MRCWHALVMMALAATWVLGCATGVTGADEVDTDGGVNSGDDAASPNTQKDAGFAIDTGTSTYDAGTTTVDSGGNNNNGCNGFQGSLATFDFTGEPGNQTSTAATSVAKGVTAGAISRATALTATSGTDSINASAWATSTKLDTTRYYTFSLTPASPCTLDVSSISITTKASATGPANGAIATSADKFAQTSSFAPNVTATPTISVSGESGALEVRVYGYGATAAGGTMRIDTTLTVTGSLQ